MPIETTVDQSRQLTTFEATGDMTDTEAISALESFYTTNPTLYSIWDMRDIAPRAFPINQIQDVLTVARMHGATRSGGKTAFIVTEEMGLELLKIIQLTSDLPFKMGVFKKIEDAQEWLFRDE